MKYRKNEQRVVDRVHKEEKRIQYIIHKKSLQIDKLTKEIEELGHLKFKADEPIRTINNRIRKRCKHIGGTHKGGIIFISLSSNFRYIFCNDCEESLCSEEV